MIDMQDRQKNNDANVIEPAFARKYSIRQATFAVA
jgi:hypothetical protein